MPDDIKDVPTAGSVVFALAAATHFEHSEPTRVRVMRLRLKFRMADDTARDWDLDASDVLRIHDAIVGHVDNSDLDFETLLESPLVTPRLPALLDANKELSNELDREFPQSNAPRVAVAHPAKLLSAGSIDSVGFELCLFSAPTGEAIMHFDPLLTLLLKGVVEGAVSAGN